MKARDIMTPDVVSVDPDASVAEAAHSCCNGGSVGYRLSITRVSWLALSLKVTSFDAPRWGPSAADRAGLRSSSGPANSPVSMFSPADDKFIR